MTMIAFFAFLCVCDAGIVQTYESWRHHKHMKPVEEARKGRHTTSFCEAKAQIEKHYQEEMGNVTVGEAAAKKEHEVQQKHSFLQQRSSLMPPPTSGTVAGGAPPPSGTGDATAVSTTTTAKSLPFDGYFYFGCMKDDAPADARLYYKEEMERLFEEPQAVDASVCFEFCRDRPEYKFYALEYGRECYCAKYFDHHTGGGGGDCSRMCDGNHQQMCGGDVKASLYEMHRCSDTLDNAEDAVKELTTYMVYLGGMVQNASFILKGMDNTAENIDVSTVRQEIFGNARNLNKKIRDVDDKIVECEKLKTELSELIPKSDPANVDDLQAVEGVNREVDKVCGLRRGAELKDLADTLYAFMMKHDVSDALAAGGVSLSSAVESAKNNKPPSAINRMTPEAIKMIGCDDDPSNGCDGFHLCFWPQGPTIEWFADFYVPADHDPPMSADEWTLVFLWQCTDLCDATEGCVAGDIYGQVADGDPEWTANCALKSSIDSVTMIAGEAGLGYQLDIGFINEGYFSVASKDIPYKIPGEGSDYYYYYYPEE